MKFKQGYILMPVDKGFSSTWKIEVHNESALRRQKKQQTTVIIVADILKRRVEIF